MDNTSYPLSQNLPTSVIEYQIQQPNNPNFFFCIIPDNSQFYNISNLNYYNNCLLPFMQNNSHILSMNMNNINNDFPVYYNYNSMPSLIQNLWLTAHINNQLNLSSIASNPVINTTLQNSIFLNKKRSNTALYENENKKINMNMKTEEKMIQIKTIPKSLDTSVDISKTETSMISNAGNITKDTISGDKDEILIKEKKSETTVSLGSDGNINGKEKGEQVEEIKKKKKKRRNCTELLQDSFLEHLGEKKPKPVVKEVPETKENPKTSDSHARPNVKTISKSKPNTKSVTEKKVNKPIIKTKSNKDKDKNKKIKIKSIRHQKKINHKTTLKNNADLLGDLPKNKSNEKKEINPKLTKVIFHGDDYEDTKTTIDFMKYNFDFSIEEQYKTKKLITDYDQQHVDLLKINEKCYENYNLNDQNLDKIELKWSRKKFDGDNKELKKAISLIRDTFPGRKTDASEEKCLNILRNSGYNIESFLNSKSNN